MYYFILVYIVLVHLCDRKASANTIRHASNNYDIDDFINQLLSSQKFDELAELVAEKAVSKIKQIEKAPADKKRFSSNHNSNKSETSSKEYLTRAHNNEEEYKNPKLRDSSQVEDVRIDAHAVMKPEASQAESLSLKYKYLTRNAYEKKASHGRPDTGDHSHTNKREGESMTKKNDKKESIEENLHNTNTERHAPHRNEKEQHGPKKDHNRYGNRHNEREEREFNGNRHKHENHNERNDDNERSQDPRSNKNPVNEHVSRTRIAEDPLASFDADQLDKADSSAEKSKSVEDKNEEQISAQEDNEETDKHKDQDSDDGDVEENKVATSGDSLNQDIESEEIIASSTKKSVTRVEGDKVFAFVENPDYEEYHEELARQEEKKKAKNQGDASVI